MRAVVDCVLIDPQHDGELFNVALAAEGLALKPGDLLSLGSFPPVMPARPGRGVTVTYQGLPGAAPVSVQLR